MSSRLADAMSAYLRSAADQPVAWYPWGPEPFERAAQEGKPVLLDIGAVWCHWCHVMDHESYEDEAIAARLNRDWICIKVDRDERPDVDARYQRAVQAITGQGGWPLTAFLTAEGRVFYGGTYFPPETRQGRPGFGFVLDELAARYRDRPEDIAAQANELTEHLRAQRPDLPSTDLDPALLEQTTDAMARAFDFRHGGFGTQPKFPHAGACEFLLGRHHDTAETWVGEIVARTLAGMAGGGIRDHVGGGFHRYAVDGRWIVPHFEKMSYDNSELLRVYAQAAGADLPGGDPALYREVVEGIVAWTMEVMADAEGGYFASQDADVGPHDDGDYFTWTLAEVTDVLQGDALTIAARHFGIGEIGEMHHNPEKNVLHLAQRPAAIAEALGRDVREVETTLGEARAALAARRAERPTPFVDRTLYTAWNAMMASAMFDAAALLERADLEDHALRTLERFFVDADLDTGMRHAVGSAVGGLLDDQVHAAQASLDAFETTGAPVWLERAIRLMTHVLARYGAESGGLKDALRGPDDGVMLTEELVPLQDAPTPAGNGIAAIVLSRLWHLTGGDEWRHARDDLVRATGGGIAALAVFGATLARAFDWAVGDATSIVVVGTPEARRPLVWAARRHRGPRSVIRPVAPDAPSEELPAPVRAMLDGSTPAVYVCRGQRCASPVTTPDALQRLLQEGLL